MAWEGAGKEGKSVGAAAAAPINAVSEQRVEGYRTKDRLLEASVLCRLRHAMLAINYIAILFGPR